MRDAIVISRYQIDRFGADILAMMGDYEKRVVKEYTWNLSYSEMRPLLELVREAERKVHQQRRERAGIIGPSGSQANVLFSEWSAAPVQPASRASAIRRSKA